MLFTTHDLLSNTCACAHAGHQQSTCTCQATCGTILRKTNTFAMLQAHQWHVLSTTHASQQPAASSQQPAASSQQPEASSQQPATSSQQPAASSKQPAANSQQPASRGGRRQGRSLNIRRTPAGGAGRVQIGTQILQILKLQGPHSCRRPLPKTD